MTSSIPTLHVPDEHAHRLAEHEVAHERGDEREGHAEGRQQQVTDGQVEEEDVRHGAHAVVLRQSHDDEHVADHGEQEDDRVDRHVKLAAPVEGQPRPRRGRRGVGEVEQREVDPGENVVLDLSRAGRAASGAVVLMTPSQYIKLVHDVGVVALRTKAHCVFLTHCLPSESQAALPLVDESRGKQQRAEKAKRWLRSVSMQRVMSGQVCPMLVSGRVTCSTTDEVDLVPGGRVPIS